MTPPSSPGFLVLKMVPIRIAWQSSDLARLETHPTDSTRLAQATSTVGVISVPTGPVTTSGGGDSPLSHPGATAAVALGAFLFGVVVAGSWVLLYRHRRRQKMLTVDPVQGSILPDSEVTGTNHNSWLTAIATFNEEG